MSNSNYSSTSIAHSTNAVAPNRRSFLRNTTALAAAGLAAGLPAVSNAQQQPGIEGMRAPELEIDYWIDAEGKPTSFSLAEQGKDKWVFLKCFQNWCPGCHKYGFPTLKAFSDRFHDHPDVAIAGIQTVFEGYASNDQDAVRELQERYELPISMGHNPGNEDQRSRPSTMRDYRTGGTPWLILINPEGTVVYNHFHVETDKLIEFVSVQIS